MLFRTVLSQRSKCRASMDTQYAGSPQRTTTPDVPTLVVDTPEASFWPLALCEPARHAPVVVPSMLLCDFGRLDAEIQRLEAAGVRSFHLGRDGRLVRAESYLWLADRQGGPPRHAIADRNTFDDRRAGPLCPAICRRRRRRRYVSRRSRARSAGTVAAVAIAGRSGRTGLQSRDAAGGDRAVSGRLRTGSDDERVPGFRRSGVSRKWLWKSFG